MNYVESLEARCEELEKKLTEALAINSMAPTWVESRKDNVRFWKLKYRNAVYATISKPDDGEFHLLQFGTIEIGGYENILNAMEVALTHPRGIGRGGYRDK
jgi:hypothetical protein